MDLKERYERYDELLCHFQHNILRYCASRAGSEEETTMLVQEVLATLWDAVGGLRASVSSPRANRWLYSVMRSAVADYLRSKPVAPVPADAAMMPAAAYDDEAAESAELLAELAAGLDADDRALVRDYCDGYSYSEIAAMRAISVPAVRLRMYRVKKRLKTIYTELYER